MKTNFNLKTPVSSVFMHIAMGAGSLEFDSRAVQIGYSVANGSPPLRCFFEAAAQALYRGDGPRYWFRASVQSRECNKDMIFLLKLKTG